MTAPTTRETADHAELARLAEAKASWSLGIYKNREQANDAAKFNALDLPATVLSLLSEIAALREERDDLKRHRDRLAITCQRRLDDWRSAQAQATQAERLRDEARAVIKDVDQAARQAASMDEAGYTVTVERTATHIYGITAAFLANQGADQ